VLWLTGQAGNDIVLPDGRRANLDVVPPPEVAEALLDRGLRLPPKVGVDSPGLPCPAAGWRRHPWLARLPVVRCDEAGVAVVGGRRLRYTSELGLEDLGAAV
jgi:hypothetical protein